MTKSFAQAAAAADGAVATDEGSLLAAARAEGKVLVAPGTVIALTKTLYLGEEKPSYKPEDYHCERRPSGARGCGVGWG
eukprot:COSAG04_NODE_15920_length_515_cov_36.959135_1_plen_78_part_10